MNQIVLMILLALTASLVPVAAAASSAAAATTARTTRPALSETAKIEALIRSVEKSNGLVFIRNGSTHDPAQAASHLRLKWKNAGKRVRTAEDFIRYCATRSSLSGKPYQIRFANGRVQDSADYFHAQLRRIEAGPIQPGPIRTSAAKPKP